MTLTQSHDGAQLAGSSGSTWGAMGRGQWSWAGQAGNRGPSGLRPTSPASTAVPVAMVGSGMRGGDLAAR